jgi:hypothetical protein
VGEIPFGFRVAADGTHLEADEAEQETLARLKRLRGRGLSVRRIADALNRHPSPRRSVAPYERMARSSKRDRGGSVTDSTKDRQVALRLTQETIDRADRLAPIMRKRPEWEPFRMTARP